MARTPAATPTPVPADAPADRPDGGDWPCMGGWVNDNVGFTGTSVDLGDCLGDVVADGIVG